MSRVLKTGKDQITNSYANHKGYAHGVDDVKYPSQLDTIIGHSEGKIIKVINYMNGTNKQLDREAMGYGNYVMILHDKKIQSKYPVTLYAHLANVESNIKENTRVKQGQDLGLMGNTGNSNGAHLHFELRLYDEIPNYNSLHDTSKFTWVDPTPYLNANLPFDTTKAVGYLDSANWSNGNLVCSGWAYQDGGSKNVEVRIYKGNNIVNIIRTVANMSRPDVKTAMKYDTDKVGYVVNQPVNLENGTYTIKAIVGNTQLTNTKTITVKNELTATSYPNYAENSGQYYRIRKSFNDTKSSKGSFWKWSGAFDTWKSFKSQGYHVYDNNGKQLD